MRYRLRTLLIVLALVPPVIAGAWFVGSKVVAVYLAQRDADAWEEVEEPGVVSGFSTTGPGLVIETDIDRESP